MQHYYHLPHMGEDWFTYPRLYDHVVDKFDSGLFVEVGSWKGKSAAYLGVNIINSGKNIKLHCVDTFGGSIEHTGVKEIVEGTLHATCVQNLEPVSSVVEIFKIDSVSASKNYEDKSIEFVFIDGDHSYEAVMEDIAAWLPKVKPGGILAGHDYGWHAPIKKAVADSFGPGDYSDIWNCGCWILDIDDQGNPIKRQNTFRYTVG